MNALLSRSGRVVFNTWRVTNCVRSLTLDSLEGLSSDSPTLFLQKLLETFACRIDVLDPEEILYPFDCVALSKVSRLQEMTYAIVAS